MWFYKQSDDNSLRFLLGEEGEKLLICIGVNPSTATPKELDYTSNRVKSISKRHGFDGWAIMCFEAYESENWITLFD